MKLDEVKGQECDGGLFKRYVLSFRDAVEWEPEQERLARDKVKENASQLVPTDVRGVNNTILWCVCENSAYRPV